MRQPGAIVPLETSASVFARRESRVRSYSRSFPRMFARARGVYLYDAAGRPYMDFLAGAGSLNYGHNHPVLRQALMEYLRTDGITHGLDLETEAKGRFLEDFVELILRPRSLDYAVQFTGPTGTNAVEAALKLARKVTGRAPVVSFTDGFHGVTLGALALTGNRHHREAAGVALHDVVRMPYDGYLGESIDTLDYFERVLEDPASGIGRPAAVIVETVQGEGGLNAARLSWLRRLERLCRRFAMLLIVDDIQAGCGRTGTFFSFEPADLRPDLVVLSKSLSGMGLPLAVTLIRRDLDIWKPGEHNGTFRGNNHAFVTASAALRLFWADDRLCAGVGRKAGILSTRLEAMTRLAADGQLGVKGRGLMQGLSCADPAAAESVSRIAFAKGLIIERSGAFDQVVKCLPPLIIEESELRRGLDLLEESVAEALERGRAARTAGA